MGEMISRDWMLKNLLFDVDRDVVRAAPKVDAVEVVRCKNCKRWKPIVALSMFGECKLYKLTNKLVYADNYCSRGVVK